MPNLIQNAMGPPSKAWTLIKEYDSNPQFSDTVSKNPFADMVSVETFGKGLATEIGYERNLEENGVEKPDATEHILVPLEVYRELERSERELIALQSAGVDNWEGYEFVNWKYVDGGEGDPIRD